MAVNGQLHRAHQGRTFGSVDGEIPMPMTTTAGVPFVRTADAAFAGLADYDYPPHYHDFEGLRLHYVDVGPRDGRVALLMHGMPTWGFLNRHIIKRLVAAGYRCIAADHIGFGRSDKVTDDGWYSIARHTAAHRALIEALDLRDISLFVQDWGGPIGLAQAVAMPERFARLVIMNTWLHHDGFTYTQALRDWNAGWQPDGFFGRNLPDNFGVGDFMLLPTHHAKGRDLMAMVADGTPIPTDAAGDAVRAGYGAPFTGIDHAGHAGVRRFPLSLPFDNPGGGDADAQARSFTALAGWRKPVDFIWGGDDGVFTEEWGRAWAATFAQASFTLLPGAGHFLQDTRGAEIAGRFLAL